MSTRSKRLVFVGVGGAAPLAIAAAILYAIDGGDGFGFVDG